MTHYLRKDGKTVVDVEATQNDISCVVVIEEYSRMLLDAPTVLQIEMISDFAMLSEIRGTYHEDQDNLLTPDALAEAFMVPMVAKWDLTYVTD